MRGPIDAPANITPETEISLLLDLQRVLGGIAGTDRGIPALVDHPFRLVQRTAAGKSTFGE